MGKEITTNSSEDSCRFQRNEHTREKIRLLLLSKTKEIVSQTMKELNDPPPINPVVLSINYSLL